MFKNEVCFLSLAFFTLSVVVCYSSVSYTSDQNVENGFLAVYKMDYVIDSTSVDAVSSHYMHLYLSPAKSVFQNKLLGVKLDESAFLEIPKPMKLQGLTPLHADPTQYPFLLVL
jgi:hypothetical protein